MRQVLSEHLALCYLHTRLMLHSCTAFILLPTTFEDFLMSCYLVKLTVFHVIEALLTVRNVMFIMELQVFRAEMQLKVCQHHSAAYLLPFATKCFQLLAPAASSPTSTKLKH